MSIARTAPAVASRCYAITRGERKTSGKLHEYAHVWVARDVAANNLETRRHVLADCEQAFEDVGSGASWNRPGLNRLKAALQQHLPDMHLGSRRHSADGLRRRIIGLPGPGRCRMKSVTGCGTARVRPK